MFNNKRKIRVVLLIIMLITLFCSCAGNNGDLDSSYNGLSDAEKNIVGRWIYIDRSSHLFIDLYSDGTGWTNRLTNNHIYDGIAVKWVYDEENGLSIYTALDREPGQTEREQDKNGFYVIADENMKVEKFIVPEESDNSHGYAEPLSEVTIFKTLLYGRVIKAADCDDEYGFADEDSPIRTETVEFIDMKKDYVDTLAYDSIDMYMKDSAAYNESLAIPEE